MSEESGGIDPYELVLADLYAKRDQIAQAIAALESMRSGGQASGGLRPTIPAQQPAADGPGALLGLSISDAAKKLLASKRTTLRNTELVALFKAGGLVLRSKDWTNTIGAVLTRRANEVGDIVRVDRGTWGLKEWYPGRSFAKKGDKIETIGEKGQSEGPGQPAAPSEQVAPHSHPTVERLRSSLREPRT